MEEIQRWILSVTALSVLIAICQALMPPGAVKRASRLSCGLLLFLALVRPLLLADYDKLTETLGELSAPATGEETTELLTASEALTVSLIEEQASAYIQDKAEETGISCTVSVTCGGGELAAPQAVLVTGTLSEEQREQLVSWASELGIDANQVTIQEEGGT